MENTFTKLEAMPKRRLFEVSAEISEISKVRAFEPEISAAGEIVLPVEFVKTDGEKVLLGFILDKENLRELLSAVEFPEMVG